MSRLRAAGPWAITAAGCAAVVCLVGWPRPTLWALGIVVGTGALLAGLRGLLAEHRGQSPAAARADTAGPGMRCCVCGGGNVSYRNFREQPFCWPCADCPCGQVPCVRTGINDPAVSEAAAGRCEGCPGCAHRPDASGPDPETARTPPDDDQPHAPDQGGDDPDTLRNRIAAAIRRDLKTRTLPAIVDYAGQPISGTEIGLTEHQIADVALTELAPELERLRKAERAVDLLADSHRRAEQAEAAIARARDAVAEALMCDGTACMWRSHLPKLERLLGGVGLIPGSDGPSPTPDDMPTGYSDPWLPDDAAADGATTSTSGRDGAR